MNKLIRSAALAGVMALAAPAMAEPVITNINAELTGAPYTFSYMGGTFTFGATGDPFGPLSISTGGTGQFATVLGGITSFFVDRGTVTFGYDSFPNTFGAFPDTTAVRFSNGENFLGLRATLDGMDYFGYAYTTNSVLNTIGFETVAGRTIVATTAAAIPEPATWGLMILGVGAVGYSLRRRSATVRLAAA